MVWKVVSHCIMFYRLCQFHHILFFLFFLFLLLHQVNIRLRWSSGIQERGQHESSVRTINTMQTTSTDKENRQRDIHLKCRCTCKYPKHKKKHFPRSDKKKKSSLGSLIVCSWLILYLSGNLYNQSKTNVFKNPEQHIITRYFT